MDSTEEDSPSAAPLSPAAGGLRTIVGASALLCLLLALILLLTSSMPTYPPTRVFMGRLAVASGALGLMTLLLGTCGPWLLGPLRSGSRAAPPCRGHRLSPWFVALPSAAHHLALWWGLPPLLEYDSVTNALEPPLLGFSATAFHHAPVYVVLVKVCLALGLVPCLSLLVLAQHGLVVLIACVVARELALRCGTPWPGLMAGLVVGLDPLLGIYAQSVMTEILATAALLGAALVLGRTERAARPVRWLLLAGVLAALATLTKQALQAWWVLGSLWIVWLGPWRPRARAAGLFAVAAALPVVGVLLHNLVFQGHARLTSAAGPSLLYRVVYDMPPLVDDLGAPPRDDLDRARRIIQAQGTAGVWLETYQALERELGWSEPEVEAAVFHLYRERIRTHPALFAWVTVRYTVEGPLYPTDSLASLCAFHDRVRVERGRPWSDVAGAGTPPAWLTWPEAVDLPRRAPVLLLLLASPLLARPGGRRLAVLCLATVGYLALVPAVAQIPVARFRVPGVPFVVLGAALAADGLVRRALAWRRGAATIEGGGAGGGA